MGKGRREGVRGGPDLRAAASAVALLLFLAGAFALLARAYEGTRSQEEIVEAAAREQGLDPRLVMAVIKCESGGRPDAVSPAGARGLMQIMPGTAARVASRMGLPAPSNEDLFDPEINVRLGCRYLADLRREFGDDRLALAAYNAGPGNAKKWAARCPGKDGAAVVRREAFPETRAYVDRVLKEWKG
jgi:soluble lytic murein transglycosylase